MKNDSINRLVWLVFVACLSMNFAYAKIINAQIFNSGANSSVKILDYGIVQKTIDSALIINNRAILNLNSINNGVYRIEIKQKNQSILNFDIIIDENEKNFSFSFNCIHEYETPVFINSSSNSDWYDFLKKQNFKLKTVIFLMQNDQDSNLNNAFDKKKVIENEKNELAQMQLDFIKKGNNFWSIQMVKADYASLVSNSKDDYYSNFELSNSRLINSPIFINTIQGYIIKYYNPQEFCKVDREKLIKEAFEETIEAFSNNKDIKKWSVEYIVFGLKQMKLVDLEEYFNNKYQF